jgi:CRISPR-associated protein Csb1
MQKFTVKELRSAVRNASMLRIQVKLEPCGAGGLVYPPTYDQGKHIFRRAWVDGQERDVVLLDSPQSQSNRIEYAILDANSRGKLRYPDIQVRVPLASGEETYSVLQLSHRSYDAALIATVNGKTPFKETEVGKAIFQSRAERATGLFTHAPVTLVLGGWDSHSGGGPMVAKIPRALTSEIIGVDAFKAERGAVKFDPMDIRKSAGPVYESSDPTRRFEVDKKLAANGKAKNPSDVGLGNVPALEERGASIRFALQNSLVSLATVRRLRFEGEQGDFSDERDAAGQIATAALGLFGLLSQMDAGYALRSGCDLVPICEPTIEVIGRSLQQVESFVADSESALEVLQESLADAAKVGLCWRKEPFVVEASDQLMTLVERSRTNSAGEE